MSLLKRFSPGCTVKQTMDLLFINRMSFNGEYLWEGQVVIKMLSLII